MTQILRFARIAALVLCSTAFAGLAWVLRFSTDGSCIDARYSAHLAAGLGPRFNPDDAALEAWTSPALVAIGAVLELVGLDALSGMQLIGALAGVGLLWRIEADSAAFGAGPLSRLGAVAVLAVSPMFAAWATGEPSLVLGALTAWIVFAALVRDQWTRSAIGAVGLVLLRHEGVLIALLLALAVGAWRWTDQRDQDAPLPRVSRASRREALAGPLLVVVVSVGLLGALSGVRFALFADPIPWTVRQLSFDPVPGLGYLLGAAVGAGLPLAWLAAGLHPDGRHGLGGLVALLMAVLAAGLALGGAESEPFARRLVILAPFGAALIALWAERTIRAGHTRTALAGLAGAVLLAHLPAWDIPLAPRRVRQAVDLRPDTARTRTEIAHWRFVRDNTDEGLALGRVVADLLGPDATWTVGAPGARGLGSGLVLYDLSGRTSPAAARARRGRLAPRSTFAALHPTILRARVVPSESTAQVVATDWSAADPDYAARIVEIEGRWIVLQERVDR